MSSKPPVPPASAAPAQNPAEIAREAFCRLATHRIAPTPKACTDIYDEITGDAPAIELAPLADGEQTRTLRDMLSRTLEAKLQQMSKLVREDQLTGSLNRRGPDDVFKRETARAPARHVAMPSAPTAPCTGPSRAARTVGDGRPGTCLK